MQITTLRRFEFSASRQLNGGRLHGNNFSGWAGVRGPLDADTGMQINLVALKQKLNQSLDRFDHRKLNSQLAVLEPTTPNVARALWQDLQARLPEPVYLHSLELAEEEEDAVLLTLDQELEIRRGGFSAAHRTHAPRLSDVENQRRYGVCNNPNGHGHNYRVEIAAPANELVTPNLWQTFDHINLSTDLPEFEGRNVVTEAIAALLAQKTEAAWVRVWETPDFFAEYQPAGELYRLGRRYRFHAAHRLESPRLSAAENQAVFGKCNRPDPHGHTYQALVSVQGKLDPLTETAFDLGCLDEAAAGIMGELDYTFLDEDIPAFASTPSTGENIVAYLYRRFAEKLPGALHQVRLWETPNNQFIASTKGDL